MKTYYILYTARTRDGTCGRSVEVKANSKGEARSQFLANPPKDFVTIARIVLG